MQLVLRREYGRTYLPTHLLLTYSLMCYSMTASRSVPLLALSPYKRPLKQLGPSSHMVTLAPPPLSPGPSPNASPNPSPSPGRNSNPSPSPSPSPDPNQVMLAAGRSPARPSRDRGIFSGGGGGGSGGGSGGGGGDCRVRGTTPPRGTTRSAPKLSSTAVAAVAAAAATAGDGEGGGVGDESDMQSWLGEAARGPELWSRGATAGGGRASAVGRAREPDPGPNGPWVATEGGPWATDSAHYPPP